MEQLYFIDDNPDRMRNPISNLSFDVSKTENMESATIIAGHHKNLSGYNIYGNTSYASSYKDKLIIIYSGGGNPPLSEIDIQSKKVLKIIRPVKNEGITRDEWVQIFETLDRSRHFTQITIPYKSDLTLALCILCQGYLAAHGWDGLNGWDRLPNVLQDVVRSKSGVVSKPDWWQKAFSNIDDWHKMLVQEINALTRGLPLLEQADCVKKFVKKLQRSDLEAQKDEVCDVYQSLRDLLRQEANV